MPRIQCRIRYVTEAASLRIGAAWAAKPRMPLRSTFDKSPVRESRTPGSVRGAGSNPRLYRDRTGARTRGVERRKSLAWRCLIEQVASDSERGIHAAAKEHEGWRQT
jgi:hypothetical protein